MESPCFSKLDHPSPSKRLVELPGMSASTSEDILVEPSKEANVGCWAGESVCDIAEP